MLILVKKNVKYYFYVFTLYAYCKWARISYKDVIRSILYYLKEYPEKYDLNNVIGLVVFKYLGLRKRKLKRNAFLNILDNQIDMEEVSIHLGISISSINQVRRFHYSLQQAIFIVYFLSDELINNQKVITMNRIKEIKNAQNSNIFFMEFNFLFCCYYLNYEVLDRILECVSQKYKFVLSKLALEMNVDLIEKREDLLQEISIMVWNLIENRKIVMDNSNQIWQYIYKSTIHKVKRRIYQIGLEQKVKHLEDKYFEDKEFIDSIYIPKDTDVLNMV